MNQELYHFGVKGMKWGVRKKRTNKSRKKSNNSSNNRLTKEDKRALIGAGSGIVAGLLAGSMAGETVEALTGSYLCGLGARVVGGYYGAAGGMIIAEKIMNE